MNKVAFVFPGQGAQKVGMGLDAYESHSGARSIYDRVDLKLGFDLSKLIFNGPEEKLKLTYHTQPALLTTSIAYYEAFKEIGMVPDYVAGHSLGEYSAPVVAGVLSLEDAVDLVQARGHFMEKAVPQGKGTMAAVLGAERDALAKLCLQISEEVDLVELANINCPGQIVISGSIAGVQTVIDRGKEIGAKRVIPLEVSGPFHSSLMKPAADQLASKLATISMNEATIPVIANVSASPIVTTDQIRQFLKEQVYSPVLWEDSVNWMIEQGVDTFIEIGPGNVLVGLIKKINRDVQVFSVNQMDAIRGELYAAR